MIRSMARPAAALASGLLLALSFPPFDLWWLAPVAVAGFTLSVRGVRLRRAFALGGVAGLVFFLILLRWMSVVGWDATVALAVFSALWIGAVGLATALVTRLPGWPLWVAVVWIAQEAVRDRIPLGGWPWGRLGFSQAESPLLPLAWLGGTPLLTGAVALIGGLLALGVLSAAARYGARTGPGPMLTSIAPAAAAVVAILLAASLMPLAGEGESLGGPPRAPVALIQGDVPNTGLGFSSDRRAVLDNHVRQTLLLAEQVDAGEQVPPAAVLWPENASDVDPLADADAAAQIDRAAAAIAAPILVGAVVDDPQVPDQVLNVGMVWDPGEGPEQVYVKQHPVPFGEYIPARALLGDLVDRFKHIPRDFSAGDTSGVLDVGPVRVGDVICFEVAYDDLVRRTVVDGGRMLTIQTNNATYTDTGQTEQQLAMARIRSVEHGRTTAVVATNGISALFTPTGELVELLGERTAGSIVHEVALRDSLTPAARIGWAAETAAVVGAFALCWMGWRRGPTPDRPGSR